MSMEEEVMKIDLKRFVTVSVAALTLIGLTGCGSNNGDTDGSGDASGGKDGLTLTVGFWKGDSTNEDSARKKAFQKFTDKTGIGIKEKVYNDYETQLMTDLVGGTAPDIFYVDASAFPGLNEQGVLE